MLSRQTTKQVVFNHVILQGPAYEVGRSQAEAVKQIPVWLQFFRSGRGTFTTQEFRRVQALFERHCPALNEEIAGFSDELKVRPQEVVYYAQTYLRAGHCSHLAVLPSATGDGHILVGRSYEFGDTADDLRLCTTRLEGSYSHIGFSTMFFGRGEGLNDHGLVVTTSAGGIPVGQMAGLRPPIQDGFQFWALVRAILEQCRTVEEALDLIADLPLCCNPNLIVTDKSGQAALVEIFGPHRSVKRLNQAGPESTLCSTNHFTRPDMVQYEPTVMANSLVRYQTIRSQLAGAASRINRQTLKTLLSTPYPAGLCCHFYDQFFGTLRSMVFDLTAGEVEVCFGSPQINDWHRFDLSTVGATNSYPASLPQARAAPEFWQQTSLEEMARV